jgi:hypothetical protein
VIRFFSAIHPVNIFVIFLTGILIRIPLFSHPVLPAIEESTGFIYAILNRSVFICLNEHAWLYPLLSYIILFIQGLSLNGFLNEQKVFGSAHLLYTLVYVLFTALIPEWNTLSSGLFANLILALILPRFVFLYQKMQVQNELFFLSFLAGMSSMIHKPSVIGLILLYVLLLIFRSFKITEWLVVLIGFVLPYYLTLVFLYVSDSWQQAVMMKPILTFSKPLFYRTPDDMLSAILLFLPCLLGVFYVWKYTARFMVLQRKVWAFAFIYLLFSLVYFSYSPAVSGDALLLFFFPASFFITAFLYFPPIKFFPSLYVWLILSFVVVRYFI